MNKKIILVISLILIIMSFLCACKKDDTNVSIDSSASKHATELGQGETTFVFVVEDALGKQSVFNILTNKKFVGEALKENNLISGDEGPFGLYVKTVNSITYDYDKDGKYWAFYVNGEYATQSADETEIKNGETYMFKAE